MNNKTIINVGYNKVNNNEQSSLNEFQNYNKNKGMFRILNKRQDINNSIQQNIKNNDNFKLLKVSDNEKNRNIKRKIQKEENKYSNKTKRYNSNSCKKGNIYCFLFINNCPIFTLGPQYYYPIIIILFNNILFILLFNNIYARVNIIFKISAFLLLIIVNLSQIYTVFINPGIPKKIWYINDKIINLIMEDENVYKEFNINKYQICRNCNILIDKYLRIIHCDICNACCEFYDHHCPWIGKCIGKNNYLSFKIFVYSNILYILLHLIILFIYIIKIYSQ